MRAGVPASILGLSIAKSAPIAWHETQKRSVLKNESIYIDRVDILAHKAEDDI